MPSSSVSVIINAKLCGERYINHTLPSAIFIYIIVWSTRDHSLKVILTSDHRIYYNAVLIELLLAYIMLHVRTKWKPLCQTNLCKDDDNIICS
jgi:hypothetical protein